MRNWDKTFFDTILCIVIYIPCCMQDIITHSFVFDQKISSFWRRTCRYNYRKPIAEVLKKLRYHLRFNLNGNHFLIVGNADRLLCKSHIFHHLQFVYIGMVLGPEHWLTVIANRNTHYCFDGLNKFDKWDQWNIHWAALISLFFSLKFFWGLIRSIIFWHFTSRIIIPTYIKKAGQGCRWWLNKSRYISVKYTLWPFSKWTAKWITVRYLPWMGKEK